MRFIERYSPIELSILIVILIGIVTSAVFLVYEYEMNRSTVVYMYPESYNYPPDNTIVGYTYGIQSYEIVKMDYIAQILLDGRVVKEETISLNPGETFEKSDVIDTTSVAKTLFKVELQVISPTNVYETHFWVNR